MDRIIYLSNDIKIELLHNRCPADKLVYIPNGVDSDRYKPLQEDESRRKKNICFVGRLSQQKGLEYLMRALPIVISKEYDTHLFIVGSGPQRAHLEDLSKRLRLNGHITFAGKQENVLSYYHNSALLVLPSESEGMSNVLLEAMACALPVVSTALGGNIELAGKVQQEMRCGERVRWILCENGILVPPQDAESLAEAIVQLLRNETLSRHSALPDAVTQSTWRRFFAADEPVFALVAEECGELLGPVHYLHHRSTTSIEPVCYLQDLFTAPAARGRGIGRALIEAVYAQARSAGLRQVYWQTHLTNAAGRRLYDQLVAHGGFIVYDKDL